MFHSPAAEHLFDPLSSLALVTSSPFNRRLATKHEDASHTLLGLVFCGLVRGTFPHCQRVSVGLLHILRFRSDLYFTFVATYCALLPLALNISTSLLFHPRYAASLVHFPCSRQQGTLLLSHGKIYSFAAPKHEPDADFHEIRTWQGTAGKRYWREGRQRMAAHFGDTQGAIGSPHCRTTRRQAPNCALSREQFARFYLW